MKKVLFAIAGLMLLFFSSNGFSYDCEIGCMGLMPNSKWCKCATECNSENPECFIDRINCYESWSGPVFEFNECMKDIQPIDTLWCNSGDTCPQAVCRFFVEVIGWVEYKNLGQCIMDQAARYGIAEPGTWGDDDYWWCDSEEGKDVSWIEACECVKASGCDANNPPE